jgi:hypothetical protein
MNVRNPRNAGRKKGSKEKISQKDIELANHIRWFIKENDINLNVLRSKLGIQNSSIYYFMKTPLCILVQIKFKYSYLYL